MLNLLAELEIRGRCDISPSGDGLVEITSVGCRHLGAGPEAGLILFS